MKMYILVKDSHPVGRAMVAAAHASLAGYLEFQSFHDTKEWIKGPFVKVVCKVTDTDFRLAKEYNNFLVITESELSDEEVAIVFAPRPDAIWPKPFQYYALYK